MPQTSVIDRVASGLLILLTVAVALHEWGAAVPVFVIPIVVAAVLIILTVMVRMTRKVFAAVGVLLTVMLIAWNPDWQSILLRALHSAAFIAAFFTALSSLRNVAETSPAIRAAGGFLAAQAPGRRYVALTIGGHLFALLLNYGAISLLGSLAVAGARTEPDEEIRRHRTRRMLLAIQRGFIASLPWSPLAFSLAITTALVPGASWAKAFLPGLVSALIIAVTGWGLDTIFKPRLSTPPAPRQPAKGTWALMLPLLFLLVLLGGSVATIHLTMGLRVVGIVMVVVPVIALVWAMVQHAGGALDFTMAKRLKDYARFDLPSYRSEIMLLMMAGYIGTVGAPLLVPVVEGAGLDPTRLPVWAVLVALIWIVPIFGQIGMNPILAVTLIAPLIPDPAVLGVSPIAIVSALAAGWAIGGTSSPFTATTLLIGNFGGVSATHVGLRWNGLFVAVAGLFLTIWILAYAFLLA